MLSFCRPDSKHTVLDKAIISCKDFTDRINCTFFLRKSDDCTNRHSVTELAEQILTEFTYINIQL